MVLFMTHRLSTISSIKLPKGLVRTQFCSLENIRRRHGTLLQLSQSAVASARFATSSVQSNQPLKRQLSFFAGSWRMQHRSSSTKGPSKLPDVKSAESTPIQPTSTTATMKAENPIPEGQASMSVWQKFLAPKPMPERYSASWYREVVLICTVFAITGSTTMLIVRPAVSEGLGIKGVGTIFGRHAYFRHFSVKIFSRFGIPPELMDPTYQETKRSFRKW